VKYVRHYVLWKALERDGAGQDLKLAEHYQTRYMDGIGRMKRRKNAFTTERRVSLSGDRPAGQVPLPRLPWNYGVTLKGRGY
jgi:hypothetical protein